MILLLGCAVLIASRARAADAPAGAVQAEVLAHGNDEWYWIAKIGPGESDPNTPQTIIQARNTATQRWLPIGRMDARVLSLGNRGAELAVIQERNQWMLTWRGGGTLGTPLPRGAAILAMAGDANSLWALGRGEVGPIASTGPSSTGPSSTGPSSTALASTPSSVATRASPTISAASRPLATALYEWNVREWTPRAILSDEFLIGEPRDVSMALIGSRPVIAARDRQGQLRIVRNDSFNHWTELGKLPREKTFKILVTGARPLLWIGSGGLAGSILPLEQFSAAPIVLAPPANLSESDPRTVASAIGQLRLVYLHDKKMMEQAYSSGGEKRGEPSPLVAITAPSIDTWQHWLALTMLVLLTLFVFGPARRRAETVGGAGDAAAQLGAAEASAAAMVAPPRLRLQAGVLDALPLILVFFFIVAQSQSTSADDLYDLASNWNRIWLWIGAYLVYFLHTLISELITGRTIGKWIFGLRVTKLDGTKPRPMSLLIRNFVRVLEFHLFLPLIVIIFSPLHQRIGDMAAGTIVVADELPEPEKEEAE